MVDEPGLFGARNDINGEAQYLVGALQKIIAIFGFTQGLGGHRAHLVLLQTGQALTKAGQAIPAHLHGFGAQAALFVQATALSNGFFEVFDPLNLTVHETGDFKSITVGAEINRGQKGSVFHGGRSLRQSSSIAPVNKMNGASVHFQSVKFFCDRRMTAILMCVTDLS